MSDESTVHKLTRRIGPETVSEITRALIVKACREKRFRPRAVRIDPTVIEADLKYAEPTRGWHRAVRPSRANTRTDPRGTPSSKPMGHRLRTITRSSNSPVSPAKQEALKLTEA